MNVESDNLSTPKQVKRLGLRRSGSMLKRSASGLSNSNAKCRILDVEPTILTPKIAFPQSDNKINYKVLEQTPSIKNAADAESTPATPKSQSSTDFHRLAVSTNCRPYRLALSKKVREKMSKKRLEFYLANDLDKDESKEKLVQAENDQQNLKTEKILNSREKLLEYIDSAQKELTARQDHIRKVEELKQAISIWKAGFSLAVTDLQNKIEPRMETTVLLEHLHIPQEMIKYINE